MNTFTFVLLIFFNFLIWGIIIMRFLHLAHKVTGGVAFTFAIGMFFQGVHSIILPFNSWFLNYLPENFVNALEIGCAAVSAFLLYITATLFWDYAFKVEENENIYNLVKSNSTKKNIHWLLLGLLVSILFIVVVEIFVSGAIDKTLTPSAVNIKSNPFLFANRIIVMSYICLTELLIVFVFKSMQITGYGQLHSIRMKAAMSSILFHASHFISNLLATTAYFFVSNNLSLQRSIQNVYLVFDTLILIPLALCFLVVVGPSFLIDWINSLISLYDVLSCHKRIARLRNWLVLYYPSIKLQISSGTISGRNPLKKLQYELKRNVIECSDAFYFLFKSIKNYDSIPKSFSKEAKLRENIIFHFQIQKTHLLTISPAKQLSSISLFKAHSLRDLYRMYTRIAISLDKEIKVGK